MTKVAKTVSNPRVSYEAPIGSPPKKMMGRGLVPKLLLTRESKAAQKVMNDTDLQLQRINTKIKDLIVKEVNTVDWRKVNPRDITNLRLKITGLVDEELKEYKVVTRKNIKAFNKIHSLVIAGCVLSLNFSKIGKLNLKQNNKVIHVEKTVASRVEMSRKKFIDFRENAIETALKKRNNFLYRAF